MDLSEVASMLVILRLSTSLPFRPTVFLGERQDDHYLRFGMWGDLLSEHQADSDPRLKRLHDAGVDVDSGTVFLG